MALAGAGLVALGFFGGGSTSTKLLEMGLGAMLLFVAIAMVARHVVRPLARVIGWPLERLGGTAGRLARENAGRNPARTANTAAALMIGLGLVVFVAVFAQGMKASFTDVFDKAIAADVVAMDTAGTQTLPANGVAAMRAVPGVQTVAGAAFAQAKLGHQAPTLADRHRRGDTGATCGTSTGAATRAMPFSPSWETTAPSSRSSTRRGTASAPVTRSP